ncbi:response regulator [Flavobacterium sp.]|uniref:response regulator n=1 Tax=Flavobacterium sp. TaxID=239 RepID=UPI00121C1766|nr:response regulator [Flavobacterium sp.]RZJ70688.1 MAG: response regulator [Flavobacterium sp.]
MEKKRILIVDDDSRNIFALSAVLRSRNFECLSSSGAREAIDLLKSETDVDYLLLDMMMPEMDGYEAIPIIRKLPNGKKLPIVAVTAQAMVGDREKCLEAGADEYISKPVDIDKLLQTLTKLQ